MKVGPSLVLCTPGGSRRGPLKSPQTTHGGGFGTPIGRSAVPRVHGAAHWLRAARPGQPLGPARPKAVRCAGPGHR